MRSPCGRGLALTLVAAGLSACARPPARPNVLLVSVDALRADSVGAYGAPDGPTPFLDSLAAHGRLFTNAYVPLPATAPSHATLLTSLHPAQHGVVSNTQTLPREAETLAETLKAAGYVTLGAVSVFYLKSRYGFGQGFDAFSDEWSHRARGNTRERRSAADVNASVASLLSSYAKQAPGRPVFLFVHYYDVHAPYVRRPRYAAAAAAAPSPPIAADPAREMAEAYDSGVRYVDDHIRQLYGLLEEAGLARELLACVTSDHGEQLGEHGYKQGHADIYAETIRVPLIVQGAGVTPERVARPTSSMDVTVSILDRLGLRVPDPAGSVPVELGGPRPWDEPVPPDRPFLVLGYPGHTESLAVIQGAQWYIRNLDGLYRQVVVEPPAAGGAPGEGFETLAEVSRDGDTAGYVVEPTAADGVVALDVTVEARLERPSCRGELTLALAKRRRYLDEPLRFTGALRVRLPATSRDRIAVALSTPCRAELSYRRERRPVLDRDGAAPLAGSRTIETALWRRLPIPRKSRPGDELYDVHADPQMLANRIGAPGAADEARRLDALIDRLWSAYARRALAPQAPGGETAEEREALRSLGYVQ